MMPIMNDGVLWSSHTPITRSTALSQLIRTISKPAANSLCAVFMLTCAYTNVDDVANNAVVAAVRRRCKRPEGSTTIERVAVAA